jgi:hypothetical protein
MAQTESAILVDNGINWTWFLGVELDPRDMTARIYFHERWHKGDEWPAALLESFRQNRGYQLMECDLNGVQRVAYGVRVTAPGQPTREFLVTNPAYVGSYQDFSQFVGDK